MLKWQWIYKLTLGENTSLQLHLLTQNQHMPVIIHHFLHIAIECLNTSFLHSCLDLSLGVLFLNIIVMNNIYVLCCSAR